MPGFVPHILSLEQAAMAGAGIVGGKAHALARLARIGLHVPQSCVLIVDPRDMSQMAPPLADKLADLGLSDKPLAVRSSAIGEDGAKHSFAGVHDSVLGVRGLEAIEAAVRQVLRSYKSAAALAYRERIGVPIGDGLAAVLLCEMVGGSRGEPECAGVAFTCDPVTGSLDDIVVELVAGLGDKLVGGAVTPDRARISLRSGAIEADEGFLALLPEPRVRELVRAIMRIEWALNDGDDETRFDVEWALEGDRIVILQARPVTSTAQSARLPGGAIWSQANLIEVLPGILSPLSWSLARPGIRWVLREPFDQAGHVAPDDLVLVRRTDGRPFIELSALQWLGWINFGTLPSAINENLGGEAPEIDTGRVDTTFSDRVARGLGALRLLRHLVGLKATLEPQLARLRARADDVIASQKRDLTRAQLCREWEDLAELSLDVPLGLAAAAAVPWLTIAKQLLQQRLDGNQVNAVIGGLMAGRRGTVSAEQALALAQIGALRSNAEKTALRTRFLETYGHRGFDELELENPRWRERPSDLDELERGFLDPEQIRRRMEQRREEAECELAKLPWWTRKAVRYLVEKIAYGFAIREEARSESVRVLGGFRAIALEVGQRLSERGEIAERRDVFHLTVPDIMAYLHGDWDGRGADVLVSQRKLQREQWRALPDPPHIIRSHGEDRAGASQPPLQSGEVLHGIGVAPGRAAGTARIVLDPSSLGEFEVGDILVARATDPAWTPLFLKAGGIVVEHGGYLSHGAIIAREFGIPAVVNVKDGLRALEGNREVSIDGNHGTVALKN